VHGDADMAAPLDLCGRRTAAAIPDSQLEIYRGAPHGLPLARGHKDRLANQLAEFAEATGGHDQQRA
jgi:non-heme chloroperoxidase